ncbi:repetitive organellar protein [Linepithema humile]|uniref:repetitive organellar protein n=1 Tax=Linepithema humile TaxID=83485 RepID=UPI0006235EE7|nr:PREDICTED: uncharacterized protein PF11_0213-like [Linepithema humile]
MKCHRPQYISLLLQVIFFVNCLAENLILDVNFKKPIAVTSDAFLSFTLDPVTLLKSTDVFTTNIERTTNMAQALAPAYVRLGGPQSNSLFEQAYMHDETDTSFGIPTYQWRLIQWAQSIGLDVITCVAPRYIESKIHSEDASSIAELLSFSDEMGYNINWQLGYECQTRCDLSGEELGQYVAKLREILKTIPRYYDSLITGPDIVAYKTTQQQKYLRDYLNSADSALSAITWHPDFASVSLNNDSIFIDYDTLVAEKDEMYKIISNIAGKKPLWIAESKPEETKHQYLGALMWAWRLGNAAKLGVQVMMRQLTNFKIAPDYWVSLLHKTLVSPQVLETRFESNNENYVHFYSQCTKPSALYKKGAITIFGVNLTPREITANLTDFKIKTLHKYILSPDSETGKKMFSEKVLLNNKPLNLINDEELPDLNPDVIIDSDGLKLELSSGEIGFWVIPDAKVKACIYPEEETAENVRNLSKRYSSIIYQDNQEENDKNTNKPNLKTRKMYTRLERRKQKNADKKEAENEQKMLNTKFLEKIKKFIQRKLYKKVQKDDSSNRQKSMTIVFDETQGSSSEETEKQQNVGNRNLKETEVDDFLKKLEDIRDTLRKYEHILMEKKNLLKSEHVEDFESEIQSIDNIVILISKIDTLLQFDEEKVILNEFDARKIIHKEVLIKRGNKKFKKLLNELENSKTKKSEIVIEKVEKFFDIFYNLLKDDELNKNDENNRNNEILVFEEESRFKRDLNGKSEDSGKIKILGKHSRIDDLKNHMVKRKKNDDRKEVITSDNPDNPIRNFNNDKSNFHNLFWRNPVKKFFKNDALAPHYTNYPLSLQKHKRIKKDNIWKFSKLDDVQDYQSSTEEFERAKRDMTKKFVEIGLRKDNIFRKRSRIDDVRDHINERKLKRKDDFRKEGLLTPFNPRTDSGENNFYGFFRQDPIRGFPENDVFVTTGDSSEQNDKDYDYVEDEDDNSAKKQNTQQEQISTVEDTRIETGESDYVPNEFFESVTLSNPRTQGSLKNCEDLWEAESILESNNNKDNNDNNNNDKETTIHEVLQEQPPGEEEEKRVREETMKKLVNYYEDSEEQEDDQDKSYKALAFKQSSTPLDQILKMQTYQASNIKSDKTDCFSKPFAAYVEYFMPDRMFHNRRAKRSNWNELQKIFAEEMIKADEENMKKCNCRIRAADSRKKPCYCRVKRAAQFADSSETESVNADIAQFERNVLDSLTKEEYDTIMTGEILPNTRVADYDITKEIATAEPSKLEREPSDVTETIDVAATSTMDNSGTNNIFEQYDNTEESTTLPVNSVSELAVKKDDTITREMFFRAQPTNIRSETETATYDSPKIVSEISSENKSNQEKFIVSVTEDAQEAIREKTQGLVNKNGETDSSTDIYSATTENQKKEKRHDNNDKTSFLKSTNLLEEATEKIVEEQMTTATMVSKRAVDKSTNSKSKEPKTRLKLQQNTENDEECESQLKKHVETKRLKNALKSLPKVPLKELTKYEENLTKRAGQIGKLKKRLNTRRKHLLHQYRDELAKIANEETRNLRRRETWEKFREHDDFSLIDQDDLIRVLMNEEDTCEDDDEEDAIPVYLSPKQYNNLLDRIHTLAKMKKVNSPEQSKYYKFLRYLIEDNEEVEETPRSDTAHKFHECSPKVIEDEQESEEDKEILEYFDRRIFTIDPSTYHGGEPTLQLHEDLEIPKYRTKVKSQIQNPISRWMLGNNYQAFSKLNTDGNRHKTSKVQDYVKKSLVKDCQDQENTNVLYILNTQRQNDLPKDFTGLTRVWLQPSDRQDVNQLTNNKSTSKFNNIYKKLEDETTTDSDCEKEDLTHSETTNNAKTVVRAKKSETIKLAKDVETKQNVEDDILVTENIEDAGKMTNVENINIKIQKNKEETHLNKEEGNIIQNKTADNIVENNKSYNPNNKVKDNLNVRTANKNINKADEDIEKVIDSNSRTSKHGKENVRIRRNIEKNVDDKHLEQLLYFLLTRTDARDGSDCDRYYSKKDSEEKFSTQPIPLLLLPKNKFPLNTNLFQKSKNYLASLRRNFNMNENDEKKYKSKYIFFTPTKNMYPYEMLKTKNYDNSLEHSEVPARCHNQYPLTTKITDSINQYPSVEEYSEKSEDFSDFLHKDTGSISDEEIYTSKSEQDASASIEYNESDYELEKEDEEYRDMSKEIDKSLETKNQIRFNNREMFFLLPWNHESKRHRRDINKRTDQVKREVQSESNENENIEYLNENNIDKEKEKTTGKKNTKANYLQPFSMIDTKYHDELLEHFIKIHKKNDLYTNKISSTKYEETDKNLENNILKKLPILVEETIPKLQNVIIDGLEEAQNLTESVEQLVNNLKESNKTLESDEDKYSRNQISETTSNAFKIAIINVKKFFDGISRIFI